MTSVPVITKSDTPVIEIRIIGVPGTGKSAISQMIVQALHASGAKDDAVYMRNDHDPLSLRTKDLLDTTLASIHARDTKFVVIESMANTEHEQRVGRVERRETNENSTVNIDQER